MGKDGKDGAEADETGRVDETEGTSKTEEIVLAEEITCCFSFIASTNIGGNPPTDNFQSICHQGFIKVARATLQHF